MDGSYIAYQPNINVDEMEKSIKCLKQKIIKYNGEFVFLWHNSSFNTEVWKKYKKVYEGVVLK